LTYAAKKLAQQDENLLTRTTLTNVVSEDAGDSYNVSNGYTTAVFDSSDVFIVESAEPIKADIPNILQYFNFVLKTRRLSLKFNRKYRGIYGIQQSEILAQNR